MAPRIPAVQLALARAYAQAGRQADAERANRAFLELASRAAGRGDASAGTAKPP